MRRKLVELRKQSTDGALRSIPEHRLAVFSIDNINANIPQAVCTFGKASSCTNGTATMVALAPCRDSTSHHPYYVVQDILNEVFLTAVGDVTSDTFRSSAAATSSSVRVAGSATAFVMSDVAQASEQEIVTRRATAVATSIISDILNVVLKSTLHSKSKNGWVGLRSLSSFNSASQFLESWVPYADDGDVNMAFDCWIGLCHKYSDRLNSENTDEQLSMRQLLFSAFEGLADELWALRYVYVDSYENAALKHVLDKKIDMIRYLYRPGAFADNRNEKFILAGYYLAFKAYMKSYLDSVNGGATAMKDFALPFIGGFHVMKQGRFGVVKQFAMEAGLESLLECTGLSEFHIQNFATLGNARKNRRVLTEFATSMLIKLSSIAIEEDVNVLMRFEISWMTQTACKYAVIGERDWVPP